jgi:L-fuconolactonase
MEFIDSHVHFWDPSMFTYAWLSGFPALAQRHLLMDLDQEADGMSPERILFVQADCAHTQAMDEVRWIEELAATESRIAGIVAFAPMNRSTETASILERLKAIPLVRGVRHMIQDEPLRDFCTGSAFVEGVQLCGAAGLNFDICCLGEQLPAVIELVRRCPNTKFILDHCGKPAIRSGLFEPWCKDISALAEYPQVFCKLSGLTTQADHAGWQISDLRPYWDHLVTTFGPTRLLFGSDWPVVKLASSYRRWLSTANSLAEDLPPPDREAIFRGNAATVYNFPLCSPA